MGALACVFFEVGVVDTHANGTTIGKWRVDMAGQHDWAVKLCNLVTLRKVWIKIVFAVKTAHLADFGVKRQTSTHGKLYRTLVKDRQCTRQTKTNRANDRVWSFAAVVVVGAAK